MSTVQEIETAIERLPREDVFKLRNFIQHRYDDEWDKEINDDILSGKLDDLADMALAEYRAGNSKPFPPDEESSHP
jgi:hypothetical protein